MKETIDEIIEEIRDAAMNFDYDDATICSWADRIEAALERERERGAEAAQICGEVVDAIGRESIGNAANPPRNCDRFATAKEAREAWFALDNHSDDALGPFEWLYSTVEE